jgi:hypothetical protein
LGAQPLIFLFPEKHGFSWQNPGPGLGMSIYPW